MLYCPVYFALKDLCPAYSLSSIHAKGAYVGPRRGKIGDGNSRVEGNTLAQLGRGRQTFKRAYCCSFHSGFDCLCFDLVWGVHVAQCYPPIISAISKTLQWKRHRLGFSVSAVVRPIFFTPHSKHESPCVWTQKNMDKSLLREQWIHPKNTHMVHGVEEENNTPLCGEIYKYDSCKVTSTFLPHFALKSSSCIPCFVNESTVHLIKCNITVLSATKTVQSTEKLLCAVY